MKFVLIIGFLFLFNTIKGDGSPFLLAPREQDMSQNSFNQMMPKTIIISGKNGQINTEDPNVMQAVMDAVNNQFKSDANNLRDVTNGNEIPEVILSDSDPQQVDQPIGSPLESFRKVYRLPSMTRMIASQEETDDKKSPFWRSPLPFLHPNDCHKNHKKSKSIKRKGRKQNKSPTEPTPTTTLKPIIEDIENRVPLSSILTSIISHSVLPSESEKQVNEVKPPQPPTSFLMSISRRVSPQSVDTPFISKPRPHGFIAILHKKSEPLPFLLPEPQPEPELTAPINSPVPPFNPFLEFISKLEESTEPRVNFNSEPQLKESTKEVVPQSTYNFNVNLTVNNYNYLQPEAKLMPSFPLGFK